MERARSSFITGSKFPGPSLSWHPNKYALLEYGSNIPNTETRSKANFPARRAFPPPHPHPSPVNGNLRCLETSRFAMLLSMEPKRVERAASDGGFFSFSFFFFFPLLAPDIETFHRISWGGGRVGGERNEEATTGFIRGTHS